MTFSFTNFLEINTQNEEGFKNEDSSHWTKLNQILYRYSVGPLKVRNSKITTQNVFFALSFIVFYYLFFCFFNLLLLESWTTLGGYFWISNLPETNWISIQNLVKVWSKWLESSFLNPSLFWVIFKKILNENITNYILYAALSLMEFDLE